MLQPMPANEADRLAALAHYEVLDTPPEFAHDALTELAAQICNCPAAILSLLEERRQWFKSKYGLPADFAECPREITVCNTTICSNDLLYVPDLTRDPRFKSLPIVIGEPYLRFYCGMPLINRDGYALGTLCVVDFKAHELSPSQREAIRRLAQQAMAQLELRRQLLERDVLLGQLSEAKAAVEAARERSDVLLRNILPAPIAEELKAHGRVRPRYYETATVMFADFKDFVPLTETLEPASLIEELNQNFAHADIGSIAILLVPRLTKRPTAIEQLLCSSGNRCRLSYDSRRRRAPRTPAVRAVPRCCSLKSILMSDHLTDLYAHRRGNLLEVLRRVCGHRMFRGHSSGTLGSDLCEKCHTSEFSAVLS